MYNNNYGYNPYNTYMPQRPIQQPMQQPIEQQSPVISGQRPCLNGKVVESESVARAMDIVMDGSTNYFPVADGSLIITKQLQMDGTSKILVYKPSIEQKNEVKFATIDDVKKSINEIDLSEIQDLKDEIKLLKQEIKDLKKTKKKED